MAHAFRLTAKRNICKMGSGTVVIAKGMSFEHVEQSCGSPDTCNVKKAIKQKFGEDVHINSISNDFEVVKL